ncbi:MAG: spermidine synthase [Maribacter sp.]
MNFASKEKSILILSIFIVGLCSIIYELLISTTSSYFLGDSIKQFSIIIGVYMAAMGVGAYLSRLMEKDLMTRFVEVEVILGIIGGVSVPFLYFAFSEIDSASFNWIVILLISIIGTLTGLEIPLLTRVMEEHYPEDKNLSNVLALDYLGALAATMLFPFFLLPWVGVFQSSIIFGFVNVLVGIINLWVFSDKMNPRRRKWYWLASFVVSILFVVAFFSSDKLLSKWHDDLFRDRIVFTKTTPYQTLTLTKGKEDVRLYIDRVIQFSSVDEYRYHESLVHVPMSLSRYKKKVLILGGGEALAAREVLKYEDVEEVRIVDIDPVMFELAKENPHLVKVNGNCMANPKVIPTPADAMVFLKENETLYDVIIADLPDPTNDNLSRLYSEEFYKLVRKRLSPNGVFVTQATSPFHTTEAFWCIEATVESSGFEHVYPYHSYVPSFGEWGFVLASNQELDYQNISFDGIETKFLSNDIVSKLFSFEKDIIVKDIFPNTLDGPILLDYYLKDWERWSREKVMF